MGVCTGMGGIIGSYLARHSAMPYFTQGETKAKNS